MTQCIESIEPLFGQKSRYLDIFQLAFPKIHMSLEKCLMITNYLIRYFLRVASFLPLSHKEVSQKKRRNANQRSQCSGHNGQQPQVAPVKVRVHPAVAILLAVGKGLTRPPPKTTLKKKYPYSKVEKLFMLVCKVKMLGKQRKKNLLKIGSFPV